MMRQKITTILGGVLVFTCVANAGFAQTQATTTNRPQPSGDQSAAAMAQQASNPFASSWALQLQQNNNWTEMPRGDDHTRVQSNVMFQPLISLRLTEKQGLIVRPMVPIVNSIPISIGAGSLHGPPGSATPFSHLRCRVRFSAAGSWSPQARRSFSPRHRRIC